MDTIVVGVDGSEGARRALAAAAEEAALRGARLHVLCAWHVPSTAYAGWMIPPANLRGEMEAGAQRVVHDAVEWLAAERPGVPVDGSAVEGSAASALLEHARGAALLVVGTRGHGGFESLLLGSTSAQVVHHAPCPVLVVPRPPVA